MKYVDRFLDAGPWWMAPAISFAFSLGLWLGQAVS